MSSVFIVLLTALLAISVALNLIFFSVQKKMHGEYMDLTDKYIKLLNQYSSQSDRMVQLEDSQRITNVDENHFTRFTSGEPKDITYTDERIYQMYDPLGKELLCVPIRFVGIDNTEQRNDIRGVTTENPFVVPNTGKIAVRCTGKSMEEILNSISDKVAYMRQAEIQAEKLAKRKPSRIRLPNRQEQS